MLRTTLKNWPDEETILTGSRPTPSWMEAAITASRNRWGMAATSKCHMILHQQNAKLPEEPISSPHFEIETSVHLGYICLRETEAWKLRETPGLRRLEFRVWSLSLGKQDLQYFNFPKWRKAVPKMTGGCESDRWVRSRYESVPGRIGARLGFLKFCTADTWASQVFVVQNCISCTL